MSAKRVNRSPIRIVASIAAIAAALVGAGAPAGEPVGPAAVRAPRIAVVPIHGQIDGLMARSFARRLDAALATNPRVVVLDMDTFGGELGAAYEIANVVEKCPVETVAFVSVKAISAGAMISLAANRIVMLPGTQIGDCRPITSADGRMETASEKVVSLVRSTFEEYARKNGYPVALAEAMVDSERDDILKVTWEDDAGAAHVEYATSRALERWSGDPTRRVMATDVVVPQGKLLTMSARRAEELGFAKIVPSERELFRSLEEKAGTTLDVETFRPDPWEPWAAILTYGPIRAALFFLGILGVAIEVAHMGLLIPGMIGLLSLALGFFGGYLAGQTSILDMALVAVGLVLLGIEIFLIPGFGVVGFSGIACLIVGGFLSLQSFGLPATPWEAAEFKRNLVIFGVGLTATVAVFSLVLRFLPQSPLLRRVVLTSEQRPEDGYTVASASAVALLGRRGTAATALRPAGKVMIGDEMLDAVAQGEFVERGAEVEVIETTENRVVVRTVQGGAAMAPDPALAGLAGQRGVAISALRPAGVARFDGGAFAGRRVDVVTRGEMIEAGAAVRVLEVHGNRVVVAAA